VDGPKGAAGGDGDVSIVRWGGFHTLHKSGSGMLKLFTTDSPPEHAPGPEHPNKTKPDMDE